MSLADLPNELSERGVWWQVIGFTIAGCASVAILQIWEGSDFWAYRSFAIATKDLYWLFVLPLAGAIEGVRKLFEKASEIRAAQRAKMVAKAMERGRKQALTDVRNRLQSSDVSKDPETGAITLTVTLNPEDATLLLGETTNDA